MSSIDLDLLGERLNQLETLWRRVKAPIVDRLGPGLSLDEIDSRTAELGFQLPEECRYWFTWHEGVPYEDAWHATMGPQFYLPSLTDRITEYHERRAFSEQADNEGWSNFPDEIWPPSQFPMIGSALGGSIVVDTDFGPATHLGGYGSGSVSWIPEERTLAGLVQFWIECHETGQYRWDPDRGHWLPTPDHPPHGDWSNFYH